MSECKCCGALPALEDIQCQYCMQPLPGRKLEALTTYGRKSELLNIYGSYDPKTLVDSNAMISESDFFLQEFTHNKDRFAMWLDHGKYGHE